MTFATKPLALALAGVLLTAPIAFAQVGGGNALPSSAKMKGGMMKKGSMMKGGMKHHSMKKSHMMKSKKMM